MVLLFLLTLGATDGKLKAALALVEEARFQKAVPALRSLLYPPRLDAKDTAAARIGLAQALFYTERSDAAKVEIELLLDAKSDTVLDPNSYPPDFLQFFNAQKAKRVVQTPVKPDAKPVNTHIEARAPAPPPWYLRAFPFGVGQFANGDRVGGAVWLSVEVALLATNVALAVTNAQRRNAAGYPDDTSSLPRYVAQQTTAGLFYGALVMGVIDAFLWSPNRVRVNNGIAF